MFKKGINKTYLGLYFDDFYMCLCDDESGRGMSWKLLTDNVEVFSKRENESEDNGNILF